CAGRSSRTPSTPSTSRRSATAGTSSCPATAENPMTIRSRARKLSVLTVLAIVLAAAGCVRAPEPALRIGTNVWIGGEPLYLARELGELKPEAVQLVEYP